MQTSRNLKPDEVRIKFATLSPEGSPWMQKMRKAAEEIEQKTGVKIKYYPGGVMGDDKSMLKRIRNGQLDGGSILAFYIYGSFPDLLIYSLPMKFRDYDEFDYVRKYIDPYIIEGIEKSGWVLIGLEEAGFAYIMTASPNVPITNKKIWIPGDSWMIKEIVNVFSFNNAITLSIADVRTGLSTGLIDSVFATPIATISLNWNSHIKELINIPFCYTYYVNVIDKRAFDRISPDNQLIIREIMNSVFQEINIEIRKRNATTLESLKKSGIQYRTLSNNELNELNDKASKLSNNLIFKGILSDYIVSKLEKHLSEYKKIATSNETEN